MFEDLASALTGIGLRGELTLYEGKSRTVTWLGKPGGNDVAVAVHINPIDDSPVMESQVPEYVLAAFENQYRKIYDLTRHDSGVEWSNTRRYVHDGVQSMWEGWRDSYLLLTKKISQFNAPGARGM